MNNKKQSSIDFLVEQIEIILKLNNIQLNAGYTIHTILPIIEKLKAIHKEEIMDAFQHGKWDWHEHLQQGTLSKDPAEYYNETFKGEQRKNNKEQPTFQDPYNLTDEEIDNLMIHTGTYKGEDASEETKAQWRKVYREAESDTNNQIQRAGGVDKWYESGEGRLL